MSGIKHDKGKARVDLVLTGFPNALMAIAEVATFGADIHGENTWQDLEDGEKRYMAAEGRHKLKRLTGNNIDKESGLTHQAHEVWNALAQLELAIRRRNSI